MFVCVCVCVCVTLIRRAGQYLSRAVADAGDVEAREKMMLASTLAGIAFGMNDGSRAPFLPLSRHLSLFLSLSHCSFPPSLVR